MFEQLSSRLAAVFGGLRRTGRLTEENVQDALKTVRTALLEADVHLDVVRSFTDRVKSQALGQAVLKSIRPADAFVKIVHDSLVEFLGGEQKEWTLQKRPAVILLMGLQGSGKTTTSAKLAAYLTKQNKKAVLASLDRSRPAASEQLERLAERAGVMFIRTTAPAAWAAREVMTKAAQMDAAVVVLDTAGRTEVDPAVFEELNQIRKAVDVEKRLLVLDAMTGQAAASLAKGFRDAVGLDGVILTKLDSDTRGGAALSVRHVAGVPILFTGEGETVDRLAVFHPDRMASRILGMGDVVSLVEKAEQEFSQEDAKQQAKKLAKGEFTFNDFLEQIRMVQRMGSLGDLLAHMPAAMTGGMKIDTALGEKQMIQTQAIILSMTPQERAEPKILSPSRRLRISRGSGTAMEDVNRLVKKFDEMKKMMKKMGKMTQLLGGSPFR